MRTGEDRHSRSDSKLQSRILSENIIENPNESSTDRSERP
jgi:hypothetical protein